MFWMKKQNTGDKRLQVIIML